MFSNYNQGMLGEGELPDGMGGEYSQFSSLVQGSDTKSRSFATNNSKFDSE
jgi:hypothetical protein